MNELAIVPAGAGAGKTYRIETQLTDWVRAKTVRPERILAVTFTEAAASEMKQRIRARLLADGMMHEAIAIDSAYASTIHGLGLRILTEHAFANGSSPAPRLLSEDERDLLIRQEIARCEPLRPIAADIRHFGYKGQFYNDQTPEDEFRDAVRQTVDRIAMLGDRGLEPGLAAEAVAAIRACHGPVSPDPKRLGDRLHAAVQSLLAAFPEGLEATATSKAARDAFHADLRALRHARDRRVLDRDWALWNRLRKLRQTMRGSPTPEDYDDLAAAVIAAADDLQIHPGPLEDACRHATALITGAQSILAGYAQRKRAFGVIDFADMLSDAERLLRTDGDVRNSVLGGIDCVIIDEFQDTNPIQFAFLWSLAREAPRTLIVGDIKQAIMGFQGADPRLTEALIAANPKRIMPLDRNWRSVPGIMEMINALGPTLFPGTYQALTPTRTAATLNPLTVLSVNCGPRSAAPNSRPYHQVAAHVLDLLAEPDSRIEDRHTGRTRRLEARDIAVLCQTHAQCSNYAEALRRLHMPVRVSGTGWWTSPMVQAVRFALSVAANPADKHASLCFATLGPPGLPLESCLARLVDGEQIEAPELTALRALWPDCLARPISAVVSDVIAAADLREWAERQGDPKQARADLLRFEAEATAFLDSHRDMRAAAGLHGEGAQVFLGWLAGRIGDRDFDSRPDPSGGTAEGIEVATWHAAKGREWPVVVVACLDHSYHPRPGGVEAHFADFADVDRILEAASLRFTPHFDAAEVRDRFLDELCPEAEKTACRLLYVALSRARDALIVEWPQFQIDKEPKDEAAERTSGYLLANQCGIAVSPDALVVNGKPFPARVIHCPKEMPAAFDREATTPLQLESAYGRNAIRRGPMRDAGVPVIVQPSLMAELAAPPPAVETITLSEPLFATAGAFASATERGTALHDAFRVLMLRPDLAERVASRSGLDGETMQQLSRQAAALRTFLTDRGFPDIALEVPVVALDDSGSTINAIIDCLAYGDSGLAIIDHKSDALGDATERFAHHWPQLDAYRRAVELVQSERAVKLIGVHWTHLGSVTFTSTQ